MPIYTTTQARLVAHLRSFCCNRGDRGRPLLYINIFVLVALATISILPAHAQKLQCKYAGQCLAALSADLDGDKKPDRIEMVFDPESRIYRVLINTGSGHYFRPFEGEYDPSREKISLTIRDGKGDIRCKNWIPGSYCGHFFPYHDIAAPALYLSHSRIGDFIISMIFPEQDRAIDIKKPNAEKLNSIGQFLVMPAIGGRRTFDEHRLNRE